MTSIRLARREDSKLIFEFIKKLAKYEKMTKDVVGSAELLEHWLFDKKLAEVIFII